jgi:hypothetical protein
MTSGDASDDAMEEERIEEDGCGDFKKSKNILKY